MPDHFDVLGLPGTATIADAKAAYRRLAMEHHPDRGGNEERFKAVKAAFEAIEKGYRRAAKTNPTHKAPPRAKKGSPAAGEPAPGYEARGPRVMPSAQYTTRGGKPEYFVALEITERQAFEGCIIPFIYKGRVLEYTVRPGAVPGQFSEHFLQSDIIGGPSTTVKVWVDLRIAQPKPRPPPDPRTLVMRTTLDVCALGLFTGGKLHTLDYLKQPVEIQLSPGYNPLKEVLVRGRGFEQDGVRGDLIITINPVFKVPSALTANELKQLDRLNEMVQQ